ncbi:MAG: sodium:calcium antiporter [Nocardioides sp.]|nr:sodium:calcium antiporter [Nocardioides sp.]
MTILALLGGLVLLVSGGETLVRGGSGLGRTLGLSPLVIGLTVVALATSAPELAVSVDASLRGSPGVAVGNVVGSNITNVLLVLGVAALVLPVAVGRTLVRVDAPVMLALSALFWLLVLDGTVGRWDGVLLVVLVLVYLGWSVRVARRAPAEGVEQSAGDAAEEPARGPAVDALLVAVGVAMLVVGARLLVGAATELATAWGLSDLVIGLTVVAIGTSLPEVATSVVAALKGQPDLAIGNVVGSCTMNLGLVMGTTAVVAPADGVPVEASAVNFDVPFMVATALALLLVSATQRLVTRREGAVLVAYYVAYVAYLLLASADHDALGAFSTVMLGFVVPLTVVAALVSLRRSGTAAGRPTDRAGT